MVPVARRNLFAERGRFAISIAGVAFSVLLILIVVALYRGFSRSGQTFQELPGELWVVQKGTTDPFHSLSLLERPDLEQASSADGVAAVIPVLSRTMEIGIGSKRETARLVALDGDPGAVPASSAKRFFPAEGRIVIDDTFSRKSGLRSGDAADFAGTTLVVDHVEPASGEAFTPFIFVNFADAKRVFAIRDIVNYGMVVVASGADANDVATRVEAANPRVHVFTSREFATAVRKEIDESFIPIISVLLVIGFVVGAAVVGLTIYTATVERSREFGVMKAVGASPGFLYRIVLSQAVMLTAGGFLAGIIAAWAVAHLVREAVPEFITEFRVTDVAGVLGAMVAMAVVASLVPVRRIVSIDPAMVFKA